MPIEITIPRLGWSMEEGVFVEWLKTPGELVRAGEMIFALEGEKASQEIESFDTGILCVPSNAPKPGDPVRVGQVIGFLLSEGEPAPESVGASSPAGPTSVPVPPRQGTAESPLEVSRHPPDSRPAGPAARRLARQLGIDLNAVTTIDPTGRVIRDDIQRALATAGQASGRGRAGFRPISTPRARRRAQELGIDWTRLLGTGRHGRIRERDVLAQQEATPTPRGPAQSPEPKPVAAGRHSPATKARLVVAQRMSTAAQQAAPVTLHTKCRASALVAFREQLKSTTPGEVVASYNDILIHLTAKTLRELPYLNACWYRGGVYDYHEINIATAVDTDTGLLSPVIHGTDQLTIAQIAEHTRDLIAKARLGKLTQKQLEGGTFTVSNLGMFGIDGFTPILNLPQAAILGIGRIVEEPIVESGRIAIGHTLTLSLTFDHRVVDGAPAARWLQRLCERIVEPDVEGTASAI